MIDEWDLFKLIHDWRSLHSFDDQGLFNFMDEWCSLNIIESIIKKKELKKFIHENSLLKPGVWKWTLGFKTSSQWADKNNPDATNLSRVVFLADKTNEWLLFSPESFSCQVAPERFSQDAGDILSIIGSGLVTC